MADQGNDLAGELLERVAELERRLETDDADSCGRATHYRDMQRTCEYCGSRFPTEEYLRRHEFRSCPGPIEGFRLSGTNWQEVERAA